MTTVREAKNSLPGVQRVGAADYIITAKVPSDLALALQRAARENCRTISGEIRWMLLERFGEQPK
jgi:hypothetical protein